MTFVLAMSTVPSTYPDGYVRDYVVMFVFAVPFAHLAGSNLALLSQVALHACGLLLDGFFVEFGVCLAFFGKLFGGSRTVRATSSFHVRGTTTRSKVVGCTSTTSS